MVMKPFTLQDVADIAVGLGKLINGQYDLQLVAYNIDPAELSDEEKMDFIRWNVLALTAELHEALNETGWKPWASSNHIDKDAFARELVDAFHFLANLCIVTGVTGADIANGYADKRVENLRRQQEGYDGVKEKCPGCKRDYNETNCYPEQNVVNGYGVTVYTASGWCQEEDMGI